MALLDPPFDAKLFDKALAAAAQGAAWVYLEAPAPFAAPPGYRLHRQLKAGAVHAHLFARDNPLRAHEPPLVAVYPGTFDPLTLGHEDILRRAARLFPRVLLAVAAAHHKKTLFSLDERLAMAREALQDVAQIEVIAFEGLLSHFVRAQHGNVVVRGIRAVSDYDYEFQMAGMNRQLMPEVETVFMTPGDDYQFVSGTFVREIAMLGGDVSKFVSPGVLARLAAKRGG